MWEIQPGEWPEGLTYKDKYQLLISMTLEHQKHFIMGYTQQYLSCSIWGIRDGLKYFSPPRCH